MKCFLTHAFFVPVKFSYQVYKSSYKVMSTSHITRVKAKNVCTAGENGLFLMQRFFRFVYYFLLVYFFGSLVRLSFCCCGIVDLSSRYLVVGRK